MQILHHRNQSVQAHQFAMVPKNDVPRSSFLREHTHKTTFDENYLIPIYVDEVLPGDTFTLDMTAFSRMTTPIYPLMDNIYLDTFWFFVPCRILWTNFVKFMGEQTNPADSISYTVPVCTFSGTGAYAAFSLQDYMGLPTNNRFATGTWSHNNLPMRAYNQIFNEWFRDENLQNSAVEDLGDGPDTATNYGRQIRGKRHDYFTSCLPWTQKGGSNINLFTGSQATVKTNATALSGLTGANPAGNNIGVLWGLSATGAAITANQALSSGAGTAGHSSSSGLAAAASSTIYPQNLYADLSTATTFTINALRQSFQIQRFLEKDARGGTRYTELIRNHYGVINPDFRLQRPEFLQSSSDAISVAPIPQTAQTGLTGGTTPLGSLGAHAAGIAKVHWTQSFTEHGYILGIANIRADITYQQGLRKMWSRSTRYDFYWPVFAHLGEQAVLNKEIYMQGVPATDDAVFGYQERYGEYRYFPSMITGAFRSDYTTPLDAWHLAEKFTSLPTLGSTFIQSNVPISRVSAAPVTGTHFLFDSFFRVKCTRAMPMYGVPGLIDHF